MAKRAQTRTITRTVVPNVRVVAAPLARRAGRAAGRATRRVAAGAKAEEHRLWTLAGAAALAGAKRMGWAIPDIGGMGPAASGALVAYLWFRATGSRIASHLATGMGAVATYHFLATGSVAGVHGDGVAASLEDSEDY